MTITTPSGYIVELKDRLTYGDRRSIKGIMLQSMKMDMAEGSKPRVEPIDLSFTARMEEEVFARAIVSITKGEEKLTKNLLEEVYSWNDEDGEAVFNYLAENFNPQGATEQEKKTEN